MQNFLEAQIHESHTRKRAAKHKREISFIEKSPMTKSHKEQEEKVLPNIP